MDNSTVNLNTICKRKDDRRQQNIPVEVDRRSGIDRRNTFNDLISQNVNNDEDIYYSFRKQQPICVSPLGIVQPIDKVEEIHDCIKKKNYFNAFAITVLMLISMPAYRKEFKNVVILKRVYFR